jgi:hypothetical protein
MIVRYGQPPARKPHNRLRNPSDTRSVWHRTRDSTLGVTPYVFQTGPSAASARDRTESCGGARAERGVKTR